MITKFDNFLNENVNDLKLKNKLILDLYNFEIGRAHV